ncbi:cobaltochelatase subunit CobN [Aestuariirhabdus litorea]|uniref:Cobaltochelatase subunit CobN n=1 Tax=Aestuariirhabdus litorea TaxID=2528527 RepID=A0A3P3VP33_9GAMM|nr:cobaltochelatase subunit CobN [Aestuariirhabdus litorea]RRJ84512.1 cobaltochelatase subunit CobN [Aestuariirhabdus litorea]RWW97737.1 cobaltochelatase subunit CobN [Endozoicomonadaceae bacterium GTF-13]
MHLLAAKPGGFTDDEGIIDLGQDPAELVILSAQDSSLALLADAALALPANYPELRLANLSHLAKPAAYDLYAHRVIEHAQLVVVSVLGGRSYWDYPLEQLELRARAGQLRLVAVPGDDQPDPELEQISNVPPSLYHALWRFLREGGRANIDQLYTLLGAEFFGLHPGWNPPRILPRSLIYKPGCDNASLAQWQQQWQPQAPVALLLFYRAHIQSGNTAAFDALIDCLCDEGLNPLPLAISSLKEPACLEVVNRLCDQASVAVILNTTGFSIHSQGNASLSSAPSPMGSALTSRAPVLQAIMAGNSCEDWTQHSQGLRPTDIAMNISLPEMDGRIVTRAISFKEVDERNQRCQIDPVRYRLHRERARFVVELARRWAELSRKANADKRIALVLANYPTKEGRIGNGVGLDTPNSTLNILHAMQAAGYPVDNLPADGTALVERLLQWVTNDGDRLATRGCQQSLSLADYQRHFLQLPADSQRAVLERWGDPEQDPKYRQGRIMVAGIRLGDTFVGIQPARGYQIDIAANYHDPDLVPPHAYLAFYFWLRHCYGIDAIAHIGKHGNLEWLPGKGTALSAACWPDIALGPLPHLYPFIVNDPGEGAQAKRRAQAVIIDHLMPPLARADSYGEMAELELLVDELYQAMGVDARREKHLRSAILERLRSSHLLEELPCSRPVNGGAPSATPASEEQILSELDAYLCDLKEAQIRNGLHLFGGTTDGLQRSETLVALTRLPRGDQPCDQSILTSLSDDLGLSGAAGGQTDFAPLSPRGERAWQGPRPVRLVELSSAPWRTEADTRERLELLALQLVERHLGDEKAPLSRLDSEGLPRTRQLFEHIAAEILPAFDGSPANELANFLRALDGHFVPAGPSGAPSRGRLDVLPTGRNFYSVDSRAIPTPAAWELAQRSADQLLMRHLQEHGEYPSRIGLSVWGTATMRTGGDDIAQAMALMGIRPRWAAGSNRLAGFEIIPAFLLGRPRVDVTLRVSGFFRDAFPNVIELFDAAVQALAIHEESGDQNPIRQQSLAEEAMLREQGLPPEVARQQSRWRIFGSKPGAYGAGLQGLIDERCWESADDLARAYLNWGGYAYGLSDGGTPAFGAFEQRLSTLQAVVHNQDNREHDLLDSDDYYQFQGGMGNAVRVLSGSQPAIYHNDHSNPAAPLTRTLNEELNRVIRSRVLNPKWIEAMRQHGYKGGFEMAATVDYLFAYDATTDLVDDYQYAAVTDTLLLDADNRAFLEQYNPNALQEMGERLLEAIQRGLWRDAGEHREAITHLLLELDQSRELSGHP